MGLPAARWHDLRHSFAVNSLSAGEYNMQVSEWLGRPSFVTTLNAYADFISRPKAASKRPSVFLWRCGLLLGIRRS